MYKLRIWGGPGRDWWVQLSSDKEDWMVTPHLAEGSELTIEWIQKNLGSVYLHYAPERVEILQVREHRK